MTDEPLEPDRLTVQQRERLLRNCDHVPVWLKIGNYNSISNLFREIIEALPVEQQP